MFAFPTIAFIPMLVALLKKFQRMMPRSKKSWKYSTWTLIRFEKTTYRTVSISMGSRRDQKYPSIEFLYLSLNSLHASCQIRFLYA